ncbi:hypothetical protein [Plasmodium yoelii yoelii]|uniref:Uncharacterized protein n=1 Tax=Plasmodium yoelii yoelii TaxID=73239 RepID=Q7RN95_PLAYO|nr:hypothetical protein [Plasmodium yoelii yoelii]
MANHNTLIISYSDVNVNFFTLCHQSQSFSRKAVNLGDLMRLWVRSKWHRYLCYHNVTNIGPIS